MRNIEYISGGKELLDKVAPLWNKLKKHHVEVSLHFLESISERTFEWRKSILIKKSEKGKLRVDLAKLSNSRTYIAYCVSTIDREGVGEIDSIFISKKYRNHGVGNFLMKRSLKWMDKFDVKSKFIIVLAGNEDVYPFYKKFGFVPAWSRLEYDRRILD
ncbi:MAG: GNAT family N-acetyltransferase [bacterium]